MVKLSRIYTKGGDKGKTSLGNGNRVAKNSERLQAIGTVDELNASIGLIPFGQRDSTMPNTEFCNLLKSLQNDLFDVGGDLCFPEDAKPDYALKVEDHYIERLEKWIDYYNKDLPELNSFVLPGGSQASSSLHLARTIARRAERDICALREKEAINDCVLQYINRLSDLFFVLARYHNQKGENDVLWQPGGKDVHTEPDNL